MIMTLNGCKSKRTTFVCGGKHILWNNNTELATRYPLGCARSGKARGSIVSAALFHYFVYVIDHSFHSRESCVRDVFVCDRRRDRLQTDVEKENNTR